MNYALNDFKAVIEHPAVNAAMYRHVGVDPVPQTPTWRFADRDNLTSPFVYLRNCTKAAVIDAVITGPDQEGLRKLLFMPEEGTSVILAALADEIASFAEEYAVAMQFGAEGVRSYRTFMEVYHGKS